MSRKQRTPEEIEAEMQDQAADPQDGADGSDAEEDEDQEEEDQEESEDEDEDEEEESSSDDPDKYAILLEDESDLLCLGYSPEQLEQLLPPLLAHCQGFRKNAVVGLSSVAGPEVAAEIMEAFDEHVIPALKEVMAVIRRHFGTNHGKAAAVNTQFASGTIYPIVRAHTDLLSAKPWPKPENG